PRRAATDDDEAHRHDPRGYRGDGGGPGSGAAEWGRGVGPGSTATQPVEEDLRSASVALDTSTRCQPAISISRPRATSSSVRVPPVRGRLRGISTPGFGSPGAGVAAGGAGQEAKAPWGGPPPTGRRGR